MLPTTLNSMHRNVLLTHCCLLLTTIIIIGIAADKHFIRTDRIGVDRRRVTGAATFTSTNQWNHLSSCVLHSTYWLEPSDCSGHYHPKPPREATTQYKKDMKRQQRVSSASVVTRSYSTSWLYPNLSFGNHKDDTPAVFRCSAVNMRAGNEHPADSLHWIRIAHRIQDVVNRRTRLPRLSRNSLRPAACWSLAL